jgi:hypothetical protein
MQANAPIPHSRETQPAERVDGNRSARAGLDAMKGLNAGAKWAHALVYEKQNYQTHSWQQQP